MRKRLRPTLATRIALLAVSVAVLTSVAGIVISVNLLQRAGEQTARAALVALADQAEATAQVGVSPEAAQARARKALQSINVQIAVVRTRANGAPTLVGDQVAVRSLTPDQTQRLSQGESLSLRLPRDDGILLVEARPTPAGGLVLAQRRGDALALGGQALQQLTISLVITGLIAAALGLLVAWRLSRSLKRTAAAATAMAQGSRDVAIPEEGPREVAEVAASVNRLAGALSPLRGPAARVPPLGVPRPADPADRDHRICRVAGRRGGPAGPPGRGRDGHRRRGETAGTPGRRPARPGPAGRHGDADGLRSGGPARRRRRRRRDLAAPLCAAGVDFRVEAVGSRPIVVFADAQRLRQALDGLLENALRVTPQGAPIVVATHTEPGGVAVLEVRDGGPGLSDDDLTVAFERSALYERYRGIRQVGTGLGLAIVHRIVERLGGTVEAGHALEGGARFTIRMPLLTPTADRTPTPEAWTGTRTHP